MAHYEEGCVESGRSSSSWDHPESSALVSGSLEVSHTGSTRTGGVRPPHSPWFTTTHFDGHLSVLIRASRLGELDREELVEVVQEAWLSRASSRRAQAWLRSVGLH